MLAQQTLSDGVDVGTSMFTVLPVYWPTGDYHLYYKYELRCPHSVELDIAAGRKENTVMPFAETIKVMKMIDIIKKQGGARFARDHD